MSNHSEYITTAIVYPNARIHLGFAWECIATDWLARSHRVMGRPTRFVTGMDVHSINVQKAAVAQNLAPVDYCKKMGLEIEAVLKSLDVKFDRFISTHDEDHQKVVQTLVQRAFDSGDVYKAKYEGHYCEGCEEFKLEKDLIEGKCPNHKTAPKWISEENYFFKLSKYQDRLLKLFKENPGFLQPEHRKSEIVNFIEAGLKDFSISRSTFDWGIPLPFDQKHIVYVWFDALINYLTAAGFGSSEADFKKFWPASCHIVGKDITRFHCIYWPAMLWSLGIELPKKVFAHGFLSIRGDRMSKSTGNVIAPEDVLAITGSDQLRYYLLAENNFGQDGNFAWDLMSLKVNADLANDWGNLVNRTINMVRKYFPGETLTKPEKITHSQEVIDSFSKLKGELEVTIQEVNPMAYAQACTARSRVLNLYIDRTKPWGLAKANTPESMAELREVLYTLMEGIRWVASGLLPVLPAKMPEVFKQLNVKSPEELGAVSQLEWGQGVFLPGEPSPIYPRIELPKELVSGS